jgi:Aspartate/tyrosine/aromatic aminotransferase
VLIMADDIYEPLRYDATPFSTFAAAAPQLAERTLTVNGVSKSHAMTGWRLGYAAGPAWLIDAMQILQSQSTSNPQQQSRRQQRLSRCSNRPNFWQAGLLRLIGDVSRC